RHRAAHEHRKVHRRDVRQPRVAREAEAELLALVGGELVLALEIVGVACRLGRALEWRLERNLRRTKAAKRLADVRDLGLPPGRRPRSRPAAWASVRRPPARSLRRDRGWTYGRTRES